ncbi:cationic peroxidase 1-like [Phragmites australis]|uniref:cationic peroxidase 1-like n=1 Tax=Phragmites australis TaxID=29695 RepID=UPI002D783797|nr:cationic peroxidase 1-like [Phragmites australis]
MIGEKTAKPNNMSVRGYDVIDTIKSAVNTVCFGNDISYADILAVAARDSIVVLGGTSYDVLLSRRDATTASIGDANGIQTPLMHLPALLANFQSSSPTASHYTTSSCSPAGTRWATPGVSSSAAGCTRRPTRWTRLLANRASIEVV